MPIAHNVSKLVLLSATLSLAHFEHLGANLNQVVAKTIGPPNPMIAPERSIPTLTERGCTITGYTASIYYYIRYNPHA